jgi:hypothetical protein
MTRSRKKTDHAARLKHLLVLPLIIGLLCASTHAFSQDQPRNGPPPPPPPDELFKKINLFKKHKKDTLSKKGDTLSKNQASKQQLNQPAGPPPPPNPLNIFKKKSKKDTTRSIKS